MADSRAERDDHHVSAEVIADGQSHDDALEVAKEDMEDVGLENVDSGQTRAQTNASTEPTLGVSRRETRAEKAGDELDVLPRDDPRASELNESSCADPPHDEDEDGDSGASSSTPTAASTPARPRPNGIRGRSPAPPPSPTFIERSTPPRTPTRVMSPSPPAVTVTPPPNRWQGESGANGSAAVEVPHFKPIERREGSSLRRPGGAESQDDAEEIIDLPLSAPFGSISLSIDQPDRTTSDSRARPAPLTRGHSQPSVLEGGGLSQGDDKRSKRSSFAYGSGAVEGSERASTLSGHGKGAGSGGSEGGKGGGPLGFLRRSSSGRKGENGRSSPLQVQTALNDPRPASSEPATAGPSHPGPWAPARIAAPSAHPHSDNPTIAALIAKGLDPKTAPSYLATRDGNESPPPPASEDKRGKRKSMAVFGITKRTSHEGEVRAANGDTDAGRASTSHVDDENSGDGPSLNGRPAPLARQPSNHAEHAAHGAAAGPSMLDKVRNQTRQVTLPPKSREEDEGHLRAWEAMMNEARMAEKHRQERQQQIREARERKLAESLPVWESILALYGDNSTRDWREHVHADPKLRKVWFEGCPSHLRGRIWALCIGNGLALSKGAFKACSVRAQKAIKAGRFPADLLEQIERSSATVFPFLKLFQPSSPMQEELQDLLCAWYVSRVDEGLGYIPTIALLAAMLLMTMSLPLAFVSLRNLLERDVLKSFYCRHQDQSDAYYRIFDNLQADLFPKIYANCKHLGIRLPSSYFTTLFLHQLPFDAACRVWDQILLDGDGYIFRTALAILALLEPRLHFPDKREIESILEGRNPATLAIVQRERERARQKGLTFNEDIDGVLSVFHVDEQTLFDRLAQDQWKESRYERLVQREMPDL